MNASAYSSASKTLDAVIRQIRDDDWSRPTPCGDWDTRALVNHLVGEARWTVPLLDGSTIADVGDRLSGDLLGSDPVAAWAAAYTDAHRAVVAANGDALVHLSYGDVPTSEYVEQLTADYLVHAWDLAVAVGVADGLDPDVVEHVSAWFVSNEAAYRSAGLVGPRPLRDQHDDAQARLLAMFGRARPTQDAADVLAAVDKFAAAFDRHDIDAVMEAMTPDCVFEATTPPDGVRHQGQAAVRQAWKELFAAIGDAVFETEDRFVCDDRVVVRWLYTWAPGPAGHVRGVDLFRVRAGRVAEKIAYVKG